MAEFVTVAATKTNTRKAELIEMDSQSPECVIENTRGEVKEKSPLPDSLSLCRHSFKRLPAHCTGNLLNFY